MDTVMNATTLTVMPKFRRIAKGPSRGRLPLDLEEMIRDEAHLRRTSFEAILTWIVAKGAGKDPSEYGIMIEDSQAQ